MLLPGRQPTTGLSVLRSDILCSFCHHYRTWAQIPCSYWSGTTDDSEQRWHWGAHSPTLYITSRQQPLNSVKSTVSTAVSAVSCVMLYRLQGLYINDYMNWNTRYWLVENYLQCVRGNVNRRWLSSHIVAGDIITIFSTYRRSIMLPWPYPVLFNWWPVSG